MPHHTSPSGGEASPNSHLRSTSALTADMTSQMKKAPPSPRPKRRIRPELVSSTSVESNSSSADVFAKANAAASPPAALAAADHSRKRKRDVDTKEDQEGDSLPSSSESAHHAASFVFDPSAAPSESARAASAAVVQERIAQFLSGSEPVHATTAAQRNRMSKDLLLQRNIEIQATMLSFDREYDRLLNSYPSGWESAVKSLDEQCDKLAEESDEIETLLFEKHRVVGGGRSLLSDEVMHAAQVGTNMADAHRQKGLPVPKLTVTTPDQTAASTTETPAAAAAAAASSGAVSNDTPVAASSTTAAADVSDVQPAAVPVKLYPASSRSDAAVLQRLDLAQEATRVRRAARRTQEKESLLGQYMAHWEKFIDVDRKPTTTTKPHHPRRTATTAHRPASFPLYLGTVVFPVFTEEAEIRAPASSEEEAPGLQEEDAEEEMKESTVPSAAAAATEAVPPHLRKRRRSVAGLSEVESKSSGVVADSLDEAAEESSDSVASREEEEDQPGENVWLDFAHDPTYHDGCVVRQVRPSSLVPDGEETIVVGLLPLADMHPPQPHQEEEDDALLDETGEPRTRRTRAKIMPDPTHALAALYILHDANVVRLESTLVRDNAESASTTGASVEVTIFVHSRIYDQYLLRTIAQKAALRTLFRLFATAADEEAPDADASSPVDTKLEPALYPNADGVMVPYADLNEDERRIVAFTESEPLLTETTDADEKVKLEPADEGVQPMDLDSDSDEENRPKPPAETIQRNEQNKRRAVDPSLSALDRMLDGDELRSSDEDEDDEDDKEDDEDGEEEDEDDEEESPDSEDELFDRLADEPFVFVDLALPRVVGADDGEAAPEPARTPSASPPLSSPAEVVPTSQVTEEELASYRQLEKVSAELDEKSGSSSSSKKVQLSAEEQQLEAESKAQWRPDTLHALFESIRPTPAWTAVASQPAGLRATLRPFQQKALAWMMSRETAPLQEFDNPLWETARLNGRTVYYQPFAGIISKEPPPKCRDVRGGILAEEMGLGKTIEVMALVLKRPWQPSQTEDAIKKEEDATTTASTARQTSEKLPPLPSIGATLIVSPMSLVYQWQKEISIHAPSLKVFVYEGTQQVKSPEAAARLYQTTMVEFATADLVLTNYSTLGAEVNYSKQCQYSFRGAKQYAVPRSPLLDCHFHRVILDEAQMVHNSLSVCFKMASRISSTSRFCVSGTPIGPQGLHDTYGLISFLGCAEYSSVGTWRTAMRAHTPDGLARLRTLLKRLMWRHAKSHVLDEVCLPKLHISKIYLDFSKVESEYYRRLEHDCQSNVFFETAKGRLEDRTAFKKLEALRQACAHPQASSGTFLGKEVKSIPDIGKMLVARVMGEAATCERDLCRAMNRLAMEYRRQGRIELAEETFTQSWKIADGGVAIEVQKNETTASAAGVSGRGSSAAMASAAQAAQTSSKSLDAFETDTNIVTQNTQLRQWRLIELVTCYQLGGIFRQQLRDRFGHEVDELTSWRENGRQVFDRLMADVAAQVPAFMAADVAQTAKAAVLEAEAASKMLPPQLMAGAAAAAAAAPADQAASSATQPDDPLASLLKRYRAQKHQFEYTLHDLFDLIEENLSKSAILIGLTYEADLLPKYVASSCLEVVELYEERMQVGVEEFNRLSRGYFRRIEDLLSMVEEDKETQEAILTLYDLSRSKRLVLRLQEHLQDRKRRLLHDAMLVELHEKVKHRFRRQSFYPQSVRKSTPKSSSDRPARQKRTLIDHQLRHQVSQLEKAIARRRNALPDHLRDQIDEEDDMTHIDFTRCQHRKRYDEAWHSARDSAQALRIMKEIKLQRSKMRIYIQKMLESRTALLRDNGVITASDARDAIEEVRREVFVEDEDSNDPVDPETRPRPKKKAKKVKTEPAAAAAAESNDEYDAMDSDAHADDDASSSADRVPASAVCSLEREIAGLQSHAKSIHANVNWLKAQFGLLSASDSSVRNHVCSICAQEMTQPALTVCGHYFDWGCLARWLKGKEMPSCPTCRRALGHEDYAAFSTDELPETIQYDEEKEATSSTSDEAQAATAATSSAQSAAAFVEPAAASSSSVVPASSASGASPSDAPNLADIHRLKIVGEGRLGSKIEAICKHILHLYRADPTVKVLVFSQYHRMLHMVATALAQNGLNHLHLTGTPAQRAKQIDRFQNDPHCTAFLMSLRTDNSGLTLVSASAVFLMEPSLNPSIEAQAVTRVHRIGQTRETRVFKFIMNRSVEYAIDQMASQHDGAAAIQTDAEALMRQSKESLSVSQLLTVLHLSDDATPQEEIDPDERDHLDAAATQ